MPVAVPVLERNLPLPPGAVRGGAGEGRGRAAPFDQPFYVMANLAVGGRLSEESNAGGLAAKSFPAQFALDWIRGYRCASDPATARACIR